MNTEQPATAEDVISSGLICGRSLQEQLAAQQSGTWIIAYPKAVTEGLMTGAVKAGIRTDGLVKVMYEDGEQEDRNATPELLATVLDEINLMKLVGFVQDGRSPHIGESSDGGR